MIVSDASWPFSVHLCVSFNLEQWYMCKKDRPQNASESMEEGEDLMSTTFDSNQSKNIPFFLKRAHNFKATTYKTIFCLL